MPIVNKLRDAISGSEEQEFTYQCGNCEHEFTSTTADMGELRCPSCGKRRVHQARPDR